MGNGGIIGVKNTSTSGIWTMEDVMLDVNGIRTTLTPQVGSYKKTSIIGVQDTGTRSTDGAGLVQVAYDDEAISQTTLDTAYFDEHPAYQFDEYIYGGNYFRKIPITYWWRGELPDVSDGTTPRWTMLMSTKPGTVTIHGVGCEFKANPGAFKRNGAWMDQFYFGTYRAHNDGGVPGSVAGQTHWGKVSFDAFKAAAEGMGDGHHMISLFEWHEILARMVVEKSTFQLFPESVRGTRSLCHWRGIQDVGYSDGGQFGLLDGVRTNATPKYETILEAGGVYETSTVSPSIVTDTTFTTSIVSGGVFDFLFIGATTGSEAASFIPDSSGRLSSTTSGICVCNVSTISNTYGALNNHWSFASTATDYRTSSRLCKW